MSGWYLSLGFYQPACHCQNTFVGDYLKKHKGPDAMKQANKAWMESEVRAAIMASRSNKVPVAND